MLEAPVGSVCLDKVCAPDNLRPCSGSREGSSGLGKDAIVELGNVREGSFPALFPENKDGFVLFPKTELVADWLAAAVNDTLLPGLRKEKIF